MLCEFCDPFGKVSKRFRWLYRRLGFKYVIPFLILLIYTIIGGAIFRHLELTADKRNREIYKNATVYAYEQLMGRMLEIQCHDPILMNDSNLQANYTMAALNWYLRYMNLSEVIKERTADRTPWTWFGSMFYAGTLYTTIGYGRPATKTAAGQFATCVYIMIGIPIFLTILKEVGKYLSRFLRKTYKKWKKAREKIPAPPPQLRRASAAVTTKLSLSPTHHPFVTAPLPPPHQTAANVRNNIAMIEQGFSEAQNDFNEEQETQLTQRKFGIEQNPNPDITREQKQFPVSLALGILLIWILMSAALFCIWETEWGYFTSVYFFFVSISTVGLGDTVPSNPDMMLANFLLIIVGLSLLSMCINLIQTWIEHLLDDMLRQFIEEFEKIAAVAAMEDEGEEVRPFEVGVTGTFATAPLVTLGKEQSIGSVAKNWFAERLATSLARNVGGSRRDSLASSSDESEDELYGSEDVHLEEGDLEGSHECHSPEQRRLFEKNKVKRVRKTSHNIPALRAMQLISRASQHSGLRGQLMSRMISNEKMHLLEATIQKRVTNKTIAVQTDNEFTELLNFLAIPRNDIDSPDLSTRLSCNRSPSNLTLRTLQSYHTAFERLPSMDNSYTRNHARAQMNDSGIYHIDSNGNGTPLMSTPERPRYLELVTFCPKCGHKIPEKDYLLRRQNSTLSESKRVSFTLPDKKSSLRRDKVSDRAIVDMPHFEANPSDSETEELFSTALDTDTENSYYEAVNCGDLRGYPTSSSPIDDEGYFESRHQKFDNLDFSPESMVEESSDNLLTNTASSDLDLQETGTEIDSNIPSAEQDFAGEKRFNWQMMPRETIIESRSSPDDGIRYLDVDQSVRSVLTGLLDTLSDSDKKIIPVEPVSINSSVRSLLNELVDTIAEWRQNAQQAKRRQSKFSLHSLFGSTESCDDQLLAGTSKTSGPQKKNSFDQLTTDRKISRHESFLREYLDTVSELPKMYSATENADFQKNCINPRKISRYYEAKNAGRDRGSALTKSIKRKQDLKKDFSTVRYS